MIGPKQIKDLLAVLAKKFPVTWERTAKKRYVLPQYRQSDYYDQDFLNLQAMDYFTTRYKLGDRCNPNDVVNHTGFALLCKALEHDRPDDSIPKPWTVARVSEVVRRVLVSDSNRKAK